MKIRQTLHIDVLHAEPDTARAHMRTVVRSLTDAVVGALGEIDCVTFVFEGETYAGRTDGEAPTGYVPTGVTERGEERAQPE